MGVGLLGAHRGLQLLAQGAGGAMFASVGQAPQAWPIGWTMTPRSIDQQQTLRHPPQTHREHRLGDDGVYTYNRRGAELCKLFQTGERAEKDHNG